MQQSEKDYKRIVIKIGASILFAQEAQAEIARQVLSLIRSGKEIILVSSGAIASGMRLMKMKSRPKELSSLQAVAAIGQNELMNMYRNAFRKYSLKCAQVLLTREDLADRKRYLNAKNTLLTLLKLGIIPIINENDTVSTEEIKFGDNDRLSALVSSLVCADILIILSDVDGLLDKEKMTIRCVPEINSQIKELACPTDKKTCVGGMISKIEAAKISVDSGIPCVIANGRKKNIILSVIDAPTEYGTLFLPKKGLTAKKHWIAFGTKTKGKVYVDSGAKGALLDKKSLLSVGVTALEGNFESGDIVSVQDLGCCEFARGKIAISSKQLERVKGKRFEKEIIHRDNIVIL